MPQYLSGQWNAICDRCGFKFKSSELKRDWQGLMVCQNDFETRHPQTLMTIPTEKAFPEWTRPRVNDVFLTPYECTLEQSQGVAGIGAAGCMRAGFITPY